MKTIKGRATSFTEYLIYIMAGFGMLRITAIMTAFLSFKQEQYVLAVAAIIIAALLLLYLPLCLISIKTGIGSKAFCQPDRMSGSDWIILAVLLVLIILYRFFMRPESFIGTSQTYFGRNLAFQVIGIIFLYAGMRRMGGSLTAVFTAFSVMLLPSFANSVYTLEYQSILFCVFGIFFALYSLITKKNMFSFVLYGSVCCLFGWFQTKNTYHELLHSVTMSELGILLVFYVFILLVLPAGKLAGKRSVIWYGFPFVFLSLLYTFYQVPFQEQGLLHVFMGAAAGESICFILNEIHNAEDRRRRQEMNKSTEHTDNQKEHVLTSAKPAPGEYLPNPLPVPKRHTKREMDFGFEPSPDALFYDIPVSDEDDYDLK